MKTRILTRGALFGALAVPFLLLGIGCGGGGGNGGPSPTARPHRTPTATPVGLNRLTIRLTDDAGRPVDGVVTIGTFVRATIGGDAIFTGFVPGTYTASIAVNGRTATKRFAAAPGTTLVSVLISANFGSNPTATPPARPF